MNNSPFSMGWLMAMFDLPVMTKKERQVATRFRKLFGGGIPAGKGMIDFVTSPPGARIVVNGKPVAVATPAHAPFPPGNYRVELRQSGYKPVQQTVHVDVGKISKVEAKLDPQ